MNAADILNLDAFNTTVLKTDPFEYVVLPGFVRAECLALIRKDFPQLNKAGSIPLSQLTYGQGFKDFIDALDGTEFERAVSNKFSVDLAGKPTMFTMRAYCRPTDGKIHTDSVTKIITVLIYLNDDNWESDGGRLRLLRSENLENYAEEVPPNGGTLLAFRRSDRSYHGHESYEGPRRAIQMNWVTSQSVVNRERFRHKISTWFKRLKG